MSLEHVFISLLGITCGLLGWFGRELYSALTKLKDDLTKLEVRLSADYVRYDRLQDALKPIIGRLDEIQHQLQSNVCQQSARRRD